MASNKMKPIHPGEILREEFLAPLGMSANALAMALHVPAPRIDDIVRERRAVTPDTALRLARYFDTTAQFWLNLQSSFDLKRAESETGGRIGAGCTEKGKSDHDDRYRASRYQEAAENLGRIRSCRPSSTDPQRR